MQYKINSSIEVRFQSANRQVGITDLKLVPSNPFGIEQSEINMEEIGGGLYKASFTPDVIGYWWIIIKSTIYPENYNSKFYFVGKEFDYYPGQEDGKITDVSYKLGEVQSSPTQYTLLGRLKDIWDKLQELFVDGLAKGKIWDGTNIAKVGTTGRLLVDVAQTGYITKSLSEIVDIVIPINTDYWILNLSNKIGIIDEIHIIVDSDKFLFKINVDNNNYFDEKGVDLKVQYLLDVATGVRAKNIETISGKDLHWTVPIYFENSIQIGIRNNDENNKKLKGYIILYRERSG